ncbi:MAG: NAD(P)-dependent oxidoreductase [Ilumatobacteraceae bacterium]
MADAIHEGGGEVVDLAEVADAQALVWADGRKADELEDVLHDANHIDWVQLPFAGIENVVHLVDADRTWTCGKGVYAEPCAELALTMALAGMRGLGDYMRASQWTKPRGTNLFGARVTILGGGGIAEALLKLLRPFDCHVTVVRNRVQEMDSADVVVEADRYADCLPGADLVVLALPLTPDTQGMISRDELEMMEPHAWLINLARGAHIVTDDLVWALENNIIGGAGLDVTHPEPLPPEHPLWSMNNCIITPHVGNTPDMAVPLLSARISANVRRYSKGEELLGLIDHDLGY